MRLSARALVFVMALFAGGCVPDFSGFTVLEDAGADGAVEADAGPP